MDVKRQILSFQVHSAPLDGLVLNERQPTLPASGSRGGVVADVSRRLLSLPRALANAATGRMWPRESFSSQLGAGTRGHGSSPCASPAAILVSAVSRPWLLPSRVRGSGRTGVRESARRANRWPAVGDGHGGGESLVGEIQPGGALVVELGQGAAFEPGGAVGVLGHQAWIRARPMV